VDDYALQYFVVTGLNFNRAFFREFNCVFDQIYQNLLESSLISYQLWQSFYLNLIKLRRVIHLTLGRLKIGPEGTWKFDSFLGSLRLENLLNQLNDLVWVEWSIQKSEYTFLELLHVQKVFNKCRWESQLTHHKTEVLFRSGDEILRQLCFILFYQLHSWF